MIALPTAHGILFLLATAASLGVAYVNVGLGSALAAAFFTGVSAASFLTAQFSLFGIRVEREDMADTACGSPANFPVRITNAAPFPRQGLILSEKSGNTVIAEAEQNPRNSKRSAELPKFLISLLKN